ncbi:MAG TPA: hypothetical protein VGK99_19000 [Acidobacteriota bacterium]|jgi:signal transduction histidine kinase
MPKISKEKQLEIHLDMLRRVAGGIAHQSKSPLNSIAINAFILREKVGRTRDQDKDGERLLTCLASIETDVRRLDSMLDVFFHFVRDNGKPESYSLSAVVQECFDLLYHLATKYNCPLSLSSEREFHSYGSRSKVRRIIVSTLLALLPTNDELVVELGGKAKSSISVKAHTADPANPMADPFLQFASELTSEIHGEFRAEATGNGTCQFKILLPASPEKTSTV